MTISTRRIPILPLQMIGPDIVPTIVLIFPFSHNFNEMKIAKEETVSDEACVSRGQTGLKRVKMLIILTR